MSCVTLSRSSELTVCSSSAGSVVGLARAMPRCEPPRKWMRLTASMVSGVTWSTSPCISHSNPSRMPTTSTPFEAGADGGGGDDAVDAGGGAAADEDGEPLMMFHCNRFYPKESIRQKAQSLKPKATPSDSAHREHPASACRHRGPMGYSRTRTKPAQAVCRWCRGPVKPPRRTFCGEPASTNGRSGAVRGTSGGKSRSATRGPAGSAD